MTHPNYERDKAEAQAVYARLMAETSAIVTAARAPIPRPAPPTIRQRIAQALAAMKERFHV